MPRFKKKPVEIEAMQWTTDVPMKDFERFANYLVRSSDDNESFYVYDRLHDTWVEFEYNDWIIKGVQGEFYPCKPDVFEATYDPVVALRANVQTLEYRPEHDIGTTYNVQGK